MEPSVQVTKTVGTISTMIAGLSNAEVIGLFLFLLMNFTLIGALVMFRKDIVAGLKGKDVLFEMPEVIVFIYLYVFPSIFIAACTVPSIVKIDIMGWMFMMLVVLFGLAGRFGLNFLLAFRAGKDHIDTKDGEDTSTKPLSPEEIKDLIIKTNEQLKGTTITTTETKQS